jgi:hypothetical protein
MRNVITALAVVVAALGFANFFTQTIPVYISHPLGMLAIGFLLLRRVAPAMLLRPADPPPPHTGPPHATARCSGSIGAIQLRNMLKVTAYADRLVVGVPLVGTRTIMADQLVRVDQQSVLAHGWPAIRIEHTSSGLVSPVTLLLRAAHPLRHAIEMLWRTRPAPVAPAAPAPPRSPAGWTRMLTITMFVGGVASLVVGVVLVAGGTAFGWGFIVIGVINFLQGVRHSRR